jgi:F0F1-type ATP synthase delta subunit
VISRRQVAQYVVDHLKDSRQDAVADAATWLVARGRKRQVRYLVRDVAEILATGGYIAANVVTARPLTAGARREIEEYVRGHTQATNVEMTTAVDGSLIGGALIELPGADLDATIKTKLSKFVEGVSR